MLETEAEACAFVVCRAIGLDSMAKSADYIQLYRGGPKTLAESLEAIQKTAAWVIDAISSTENPTRSPAQRATAT